MVAKETRLDSFKSDRFVGKPILADIEFIDALKTIDQLAEASQIQLYVNRSAQLQGMNLGGVMVPPASRSNHLIGHAIDVYIIWNRQRFTRDALANSSFNTLPAAVQTFINNLKQSTQLHWGADVNNPTHIDDGLGQRAPDRWDEKFPIIQAELISLMLPAIAGEGRSLLLLRPYLQGNDVLNVQQALIQRGFHIKDDGEFGPLTDAAVTAFQKQQGITADGIVGMATYQALGLRGAIK